MLVSNMHTHASRVWLAGWTGLTILLILFSVYILWHFLSLPADEWSNPVTDFGEASPSAKAGIGMHFVFGVVIMLLLPSQWLPWSRRVGSSWLHIWGGRLIIFSTLPLTLGGFIYILTEGAVGGFWMSLSFAIYGVLIAVCAAQAFYHARRMEKDRESPHFLEHKRWAVRLSVLLVGSGIYRLLIVPMAAMLNFDYYPDRDRDFAINYLNVISWLFYSLPLLATEIYLRRYHGDKRPGFISFEERPSSSVVDAPNEHDVDSNVI
ncbi:hypothetical protein TrST_g5465 [Triparma strigata]|uniref:DUF2306 domain-containing protein n=2 Tax=Triparma TaxID=722752 RepID=A0A9W7C855_9STRA|nr:hypothetical protein TrST_g5465 [Triparma strigata]